MSKEVKEEVLKQEWVVAPDMTEQMNSMREMLNDLDERLHRLDELVTLRQEVEDLKNQLCEARAEQQLPTMPPAIVVGVCTPGRGGMYTIGVDTSGVTGDISGLDFNSVTGVTTVSTSNGTCVSSSGYEQR